MDLEQILRQNYESIKDKRIIGPVIKYIESHEILKGANASLIKKLTKVARNITRETDVSDKFILNTYKHLRQGIELSDEDKLTAHFEAYAGDFATFIFSRNKQPQYGLRAYQHSLKAANLVRASEPEYASACFFRAGDAARGMHAHVENNSWLERAFDAYLQGAELSSSNTSKAEYFERAKTIAKEMATLTQEDEWFRKTAYCCEKFLQYAKEKGTTRRVKRIAQEVHESGELNFYKYQSGEGNV